MTNLLALLKTLLTTKNLENLRAFLIAMLTLLHGGDAAELVVNDKSWEKIVALSEQDTVTEADVERAFPAQDRKIDWANLIALIQSIIAMIKA